jgi:hypothetical protein
MPFPNFGSGGYYNQPTQQYGQQQGGYGRQYGGYQQPTAYQPQGYQPPGGYQQQRGGGWGGGMFGGGGFGTQPNQQFNQIRNQYTPLSQTFTPQGPMQQYFPTGPQKRFGEFNEMRRAAGLSAIPWEAMNYIGTPMQQFLPNYNVQSGSYTPTGNYGFGNFGGF